MFIFSGTFHYFRCPKELWPARFQAIKDAGFNTVETYTPWNYHEQQKPDSPADFSKITDLQDLDDWLSMAEKYGFYIIVRPGPYICAEWSNGGFPRWMSTLEKPAGLAENAFLRTDNPDYLAWCKHWYDAVLPVVAKHQITRRAPGQPGVILVQVENEYDYPKWISTEAKINDLTALVQDAQADGIDVPLITCYTTPTRVAKNGPLRAAFDCTNFYPGVKIEKGLRTMIEQQRAQQPDAPLAATECQGGWFAQVGGKLSDQQPGLTPQQIQNLILFSWQMGETMTNLYTLFGGTNFNDWAGADNITSYDYNAPIREDGGVGGRYQRVWALGQMLREHGARLVRAQGVQITATATDKDVEVAERRAQDGSRYFFVRTENQTAPRSGTVHVAEKDGTVLSFDYKLEPFGSMVLYLPPNATDPSQGEWLPKPGPSLTKPDQLPDPVVITQAQRSVETQPFDWQPLAPGAPPESLGVYGSHFFYYKVPATPGARLTLEIQKKDGIVASADGTLLKGTADKRGTHVSFDVPGDSKELDVIYENMGHQNFGPETGEPFGILSMTGTAPDESLELATSRGGWTEEACGDALTSGSAAGLPAVSSQTITIGRDTAPDALLTWYAAGFYLPEKPSGLTAPWHLHVEANGNGFIYVNSHCIGRYRQAGPQHDFFLPDCWLNFGRGQTNWVALDLHPLDRGVGIQALSVIPDPAFAVETAAVGP
jgi:hypothetical protein